MRRIGVEILAAEHGGRMGDYIFHPTYRASDMTVVIEGSEIMELDEITIEPHGGKAHIFRSELSGEWYLRLLAPNGEIIAATEGHKNLLDIRKLWRKYFPDFSLADETGEPV